MEIKRKIALKKIYLEVLWGHETPANPADIKSLLVCLCLGYHKNASLAFSWLHW